MTVYLGVNSKSSLCVEATQDPTQFLICSLIWGWLWLVGCVWVPTPGPVMGEVGWHIFILPPQEETEWHVGIVSALPAVSPLYLELEEGNCIIGGQHNCSPDDDGCPDIAVNKTSTWTCPSSFGVWTSGCPLSNTKCGTVFGHISIHWDEYWGWLHAAHGIHGEFFKPHQDRIKLATSHFVNYKNTNPHNITIFQIQHLLQGLGALSRSVQYP